MPKSPPLLANETEDTFASLFTTFLACMCGKKPKAIITDQDLAMRATIPIFLRVQHIDIVRGT